MHKEVMPMAKPETLLQRTQTSGIFKDADSGERQNIGVFLMAEIMVSGRV